MKKDFVIDPEKVIGTRAKALGKSSFSLAMFELNKG